MVIRITVSDNDFTEYLERFGAILAEGYLYRIYTEDEYDQNPKLFRAVHQEEMAFMEAVRVAHSEASNQQVATVKKTVRKYFSVWIEKNVCEETAKYLKKSLMWRYMARFLTAGRTERSYISFPLRTAVR